jgi:hypothetical protein
MVSIRPASGSGGLSISHRAVGQRHPVERGGRHQVHIELALRLPARFPCAAGEKPQRNPKPSAARSRLVENDASLSRSFSSASRSSGYGALDQVEPGDTIGEAANPGNGSSAGRPDSVIVSPSASLIFLMLATRNPTSPTAARQPASPWA